MTDAVARAEMQALREQLREQKAKVEEATALCYEVRGQLDAMQKSLVAERIAHRAELDRLVGVLRPRPASESVPYDETATEAYQEFLSGRRSRHDEIHGAGISQEEMVRRINLRKKLLDEAAEAAQGESNGE